MNNKLKIFSLVLKEKDYILKNTNTFEIAYYISKNKEEDIRIVLFSIRDSCTQFFTDHAPEICGKLLKYLNIDKSIDEVTWNYAASPAYSALKFIRIHGMLAIMRLENGEVSKPHCGNLTLDQYQKIWDLKQDFKQALKIGYPEGDYQSEALVQHLVHTPRRQEKLRVIVPPYGYDNEEYPVVLVDTVKFINYWSQQCKEKRPIFSDRLFRFFKPIRVDWIDINDRKLLQSSSKKQNEWHIPKEMACGTCLNFVNKIRFTNGRHRTVNVANAGAPFIPMQISSYDKVKFCEKFEWQG